MVNLIQTKTLTNSELYTNCNFIGVYKKRNSLHKYITILHATLHNNNTNYWTYISVKRLVIM